MEEHLDVSASVSQDASVAVAPSVAQVLRSDIAVTATSLASDSIASQVTIIQISYYLLVSPVLLLLRHGCCNIFDY